MITRLMAWVLLNAALYCGLLLALLITLRAASRL